VKTLGDKASYSLFSKPVNLDALQEGHEVDLGHNFEEAGQIVT
jgi:hypothetical protein